MKKILRLFYVMHIIISYRLLEIVPTTKRPWPIKCLLVIFFLYPKKGSNTQLAENLNAALEKLGPVWIKFGQMLSTRKDLLSDSFSEQLAKLQDQVTPFPCQQAKQIIRQQLQLNSLEDMFSQFDDTPLASASIAQVYGAQLTNGDSVVVKVIRPGIEKQILADIALMFLFAKGLTKVSKGSERLRPVEVIDEYQRTILAELDLKKETANGEKLRANFEGSTDLYIPYIYSDYSTKQLLIMERINGIPVSDIDQITQQGSDLEKLAQRGVRVFFTQVFRDSFFHADMHPGNIFISRENPQDPKYIGLDFGIVGTLNSEDKRYLAENFVAFFNRDYLKVAQLHVDSGWVPSHIDVYQFEAAIRSVCDPIFNKPLSEISFAQVLIGLFDTARQFEMQVQPQLVLLQKTLLYVEGLGRQLYPQLDLWDTAKPFLEDWLKEQMGVKRFFQRSKDNLPYWLEKAPEIPEKLYSALSHINQLPVYQSQLVDQYKQQMRHQRWFFVWLMMTFSSVALSAGLLLTGHVNGAVASAGAGLFALVKLIKFLK